MAGNTNRSFIQLPANVVEPIQLRRFLDKLVQELDVAFANRGSEGFASITNIQELISAFLELKEQVEAGDIIISVSSDTVLANQTQIVLVDATSSDKLITLPQASEAYTNERSKAVAITKVDTTSNKVVIQTTDGALVVGETTQELLYDGEVLNFVTDGSNWYLGA